MLTFKPTALSETLGLGEGVASAYGHSLLMEGSVWDTPEGNKDPFCHGHLRIEKKDRREPSIGVFRLGSVDEDDIDESPYLSAVIFMSGEQFASARSILLENPDSVRIQIEWEELKTTEDVVALTRRSSLSIAAASISSRYWTVNLPAKKK